MKAWQEYEEYIHDLYKSLGDSVSIKKNEKILGKNTRKKRQIDISLRKKLATEEILVIVECKKWKRKVGVPAVEQFKTKMEDVGAHHGVIVSSSGFSKSAVIFSNSCHTISLCLPPELKGVSKEMRIPIYGILIDIVKSVVSFIPFDSNDLISFKELQRIEGCPDVFNGAGKEINPYDIITDKVMATKELPREGIENKLEVRIDGSRVKFSTRDFPIKGMKMRFTPDIKYYRCFVNLDQAKGLVRVNDVRTLGKKKAEYSGVLTFKNITTGEIKIKDFPQGWEEIPKSSFDEKKALLVFSICK